MIGQRLYSYVGSHDLLSLLKQPSQRMHITHPDDVLRWIQETGQPLTPDKSFVATFIIDSNAALWIAHQRSEHIVCAAGGKVMSAGEMTFAIEKGSVEVVEVTNQSTGFCPEPESWDAVAEALDAAGFEHPGEFTSAYLFRRCDVCHSTNIIKDEWFECAVCEAPLSLTWNFEA